MASSSNRRALITGASSGIGKATALAFAKAGIEVALISRSAEKLEPVINAIKEMGVEAKAYVLDLAKIEQVKENISAIATDGGIDILVNNAGIAYTIPLRAMSLTDWQQVMDLNLTSVFQCIQGVLPIMREQQQGTIVNVASIAAEQPFPDWGAYSISKAGLVALSRTLAVEERTHKIRVMTISPGAVNTGLWDTDTVLVDFDRSAMLTPELVAQSILYAVLLPTEAVIDRMTIMPSGGSF